jgi:hypothetical protein
VEVAQEQTVAEELKAEMAEIVYLAHLLLLEVVAVQLGTAVVAKPDLEEPVAEQIKDLLLSV